MLPTDIDLRRLSALEEMMRFYRQPDDRQPLVAAGLLPFVRENDINFAAKNLKPDATANVFFDETPVNLFCQRAAVVNVSSNTILSSLFINQGLYGATSNAYAEVLGTSRTDTQNLIYVNPNYVTITITKGTGSADLSDTEYVVDQIVYQTSTGSPLEGFSYTNSLTPEYSFLGVVKYWKKESASVGYLVLILS